MKVQFIKNVIFTLSFRMNWWTSEPSAFKIPANSTAIYPAPTTTTFLEKNKLNFLTKMIWLYFILWKSRHCHFQKFFNLSLSLSSPVVVILSTRLAVILKFLCVWVVMVFDILIFLLWEIFQFKEPITCYAIFSSLRKIIIHKFSL